MWPVVAHFGPLRNKYLKRGLDRMAARWRRPSRREVVEGINATFRFNAAMRGGTPEQMARAEELCTQLAPKRERTIRRPVDGRPVIRSEHQEQVDVISWWNMACAGYGLPMCALFAIPNGGARDPITGSRLKAEGVRRGVFDLCLAVARGRFHGLYIEMKAGTNKPSEEQRDFQRYLLEAGYEATVHWDSGEAIDQIKEYLAR